MAHLDVKWRFPFLVLKGFSQPQADLLQKATFLEGPQKDASETRFGTPQETPKTAEKTPRRVLNGPQDSPRGPQDIPRRAQDCFNRAKDGQEGPKRVPSRTKIAPKGPMSRESHPKLHHTALPNAISGRLQVRIHAV